MCGRDVGSALVGIYRVILAVLSSKRGEDGEWGEGSRQGKEDEKERIQEERGGEVGIEIQMDREKKEEEEEKGN